MRTTDASIWGYMSKHDNDTIMRILRSNPHRGTLAAVEKAVARLIAQERGLIKPQKDKGA